MSDVWNENQITSTSLWDGRDAHPTITIKIVSYLIRDPLWNKTTTEVRFYLSSLASNAEKFPGAIRSHWGIENSLHWTLDITFSLRQESHSQRSFSRKFCSPTSREPSIY